jgi:hypothetical protein
VPASPSLLAVVLPHSGNGISEPRGPGEPAR